MYQNAIVTRNPAHSQKKMCLFFQKAEYQNDQISNLDVFS